MMTATDSQMVHEKNSPSFSLHICIYIHTCYFFPEPVESMLYALRPFTSVLVRAAVTKYHRLGDLNNICLFLIVLEAENPMI